MVRTCVGALENAAQSDESSFGGSFGSPVAGCVDSDATGAETKSAAQKSSPPGAGWGVEATGATSKNESSTVVAEEDTATVEEPDDERIDSKSAQESSLMAKDP